MANMFAPLEALLNSEIHLFAGVITGPRSLRVSLGRVQERSAEGRMCSPAFVIGPDDDEPLVYQFKRDDGTALKVKGLVQHEDGISRIVFLNGDIYEIHQHRVTLPPLPYAVVEIEYMTLEGAAPVIRELGQHLGNN